jgi:hypothetical protein
VLALAYLSAARCVLLEAMSSVALGVLVALAALPLRPTLEALLRERHLPWFR